MQIENGGMENKKLERDWRAENLAVYNKTAVRMAKKFNDIGARTKDIDILFSYLEDGVIDPQILEIGCGNGRDAKEISRRTKNYLGIDVSEGMINIARDTVPNTEFIVADMETYTFPENLDAVVAFASLLHSDRATFASVLQKAWNSLTPEGVFYISLKKGNYGKHVKTDEFGTRTYYFYTRGDIEKLTKNNYDIVNVVDTELNGQEWLDIVLKRKGKKTYGK